MPSEMCSVMIMVIDQWPETILMIVFNSTQKKGKCKCSMQCRELILPKRAILGKQLEFE